MGKFLETSAIDSTKLITGGDSDPSGSPTAHDDRAAISPSPSTPSLLPHCLARHASLGLSERFDPIPPHGAVLWVRFPLRRSPPHSMSPSLYTQPPQASS